LDEIEYGRKFPEYRVVHDYRDFIEGAGANIEVLCHPGVLIDAIRNIVSNIWKHVVPRSESTKKESNVTWTCKTTSQIATIQVVDSGPGVLEDNGDGDGGYARIAPSIKDYDGVYSVRTNNSGGAKAILQLHYREVAP